MRCIWRQNAQASTPAAWRRGIWMMRGDINTPVADDPAPWSECRSAQQRAYESRVNDEFVFPGRSLVKPISNKTMLKHLKQITGDETLTVHGVLPRSGPGHRRKRISRRRLSIACTTSQAMMPKRPTSTARLFVAAFSRRTMVAAAPVCHRSTHIFGRTCTGDGHRSFSASLRNSSGTE